MRATISSMDDGIRFRLAIAALGEDLTHQLLGAVAQHPRIGIFLADARGTFTVVVGDALVGLDPETHAGIRSAVRRALSGERVLSRFDEHRRAYELQCLPLGAPGESRAAVSGVLIDVGP